ncbi:hypothetical protein PPYR_06959 [Photinus pyralis]|uniref:15-hydroxyprostaglandin dehydrogenase n=1 Tax=Photinus pyralis TaxID=7054 RepID=A0A5N4AP26_PHOPY|nr:hypothetical protein PPYR_06959 [Photinus pyralis]
MITRNFVILWVALGIPICVTPLELNGKTALVTGGSRGIGFGIARDLLSNGVRGVTLVNVNINKGQNAAKLLNEEFGYGKAIFIPADVSDGDQLESAFKISARHWNGLNFVINNAGVGNEKNWKSAIDINIVGTLQGTLLGIKYMSKNRGGQGGVVINISSTLAIEPVFNGPVYSATKSFINALGRSLGHQVYYNYNQVGIITICPGLTNTELKDSLQQGVSEMLHPNLVDEAPKYNPPHFSTRKNHNAVPLQEN